MQRRRISAVSRRSPLLAVVRRSPVRDAVDRDIRRVLQPRLDLPLPPGPARTGDALHVLRQPETRSLVYERLDLAGGIWRRLGRILRAVYRPQAALEFSCPDIGPGLIVSHGFATIVVAAAIGEDCLISQQVTIGYSDKGGPPVLGDRVRIGAGAIVIGPITLGDDSVVGAGAVVINDVPPGAVVGGVPARVLAGAQDEFSALRRSAPGPAEQ
ncbi:MAG: DapH/DapD/GlmU-related protein [Mycobacteriales bacterium]